MITDSVGRRIARSSCRLFLAVSAVIAIGIVMPSSAYGQNPKQPKPAAGRPQKSGEIKGFPAQPLLDADVAAIENELAQYMQFRGEVGVEGAARLELLIDLRLVSRWLLVGAAAAPSESDLQATSALRGWEALATARTLADHFKNLPRPTQPQLDAMAKLHALTFNLQPLKEIKQADDLCRDIGMQLSVAAGALPPEVKQIPLMRPARPSTAPSGTKPPATPAAEQDPLARASSMPLTPGLKKQLIAIVTAAADSTRIAGTDTKKREEAATLAAMAGRALEMADGLSRNTGIDAVNRPRTEQQLADGLALFIDPRTRSLGDSRIAQLDGYAKMVARIRRLNLKPEILQRLSPAFVWAQDHGEPGGKLLGALEAYLGVCERADARAALDAAGPSGLGPREIKAVAEALKSLVAEREAFLADSASLSRPGVTVDPASFNQRVELMRSALNSIEIYEKTPKALSAMLALKPRPTGGLERRVAAALTSLADPKAPMTRDEALRTLTTMVQLADLAADADAAGPISPDVALVYTRGKLATFDARRKEIIAELAGVLASGKEVDTLRIQRLEQMRDVRAALGDIAQFEQAIKKSELLSRWADWQVTPTDIQAVFTPFRDTVAATVELLASSDNSMSVVWESTRDRYRPIMRAIIRASQNADLCTALPTGWPGQIGRLVTPNDNQPFGMERYTAFALLVWSRYEQSGDSKSAGAVAETLSGRLRRTALP